MGRLGSLTAIVGAQARNLIAAAAILLLGAELALYGGDRREAALAFVAIEGAGLALLLGLTRWAPAELRRRPALTPLYLLFAGVVGWVVVQFAPFGPGMAKAAWDSIGAPPAITIDRFATLVELAKLLGLGAVFLIGFLLGAGDRRARAAFNTLGLVGGLYAAWALAGFYGRGWAGVVVVDGRLSASLLSPNTAAAAFGLFACLGWTGTLLALRAAIAVEGPVRAQAAAGLGRGWPWLCLTFLSLWALALTASRGGVLSTFAGLLTASLAAAAAPQADSARRGTREILAAATGALVLLLIAGLGAGGPFVARLGNYQFGAADRTAYLDLYTAHLRDTPWTGLGLGAFERFNPLMLGPSAPARFWEFGAMHNVYLQWLYEAGWPGAALMFACVAWAIGIIVWGLRRRGASRRWPIAALAASALLAIHSVVDFDLQIPAVAALWTLLLGAGVGASLRRT